ncbi:MAG: hypothetical protein P1V35_05630, partial [Planctomycetota bacterium]|nr:hypothetical protein [Planctomycetota bacterium]
MKRTSGHPTQGRMTAEEAARLASKDKRKLIILSIGFLVLLGAFITSTISAKNKKKDEDAKLASAVVVDDSSNQSQVFVPEFKQKELLENIYDSKESEQVHLKEKVILATLKHTRLLTPIQYTELGIQKLTPEVQAVIAAEPAAHRLDPLRVRGKIINLRHRPGTDESPATYYGTLEQADGSRAHFVVSDSGKNDDLPSDFLRLDGMFVQMHHAEVDGEWINAPLLVGRKLIGSYDYLKLDEDLNTPSMAMVQDDVSGKESAGI